MSERIQHDKTEIVREPRTKRRSAPWLVGSLVLLLLFVLMLLQGFGLWEVVTPDSTSDTLLLYALSSLNFAAFIVFAFIFVRNLLKLRRERRERLLGSKIKTRLIVYFITVSLLPITAMAVFSYAFLNRSLEKWLGRLPEDVVIEARAALVEDAMQQDESLQELVATIGTSLEANSASLSDPQLKQFLERSHLAALELSAGDGLLQESVDANYLGRDADLSEALTQARKLYAGSGARMSKHGGFGVAVFPLSDGRVLLAARASQVDARLVKIASGAETYEQLRKKQRSIRLLGLSILGLMTLLLLFAATWSAIHLARGIAKPIRALAEAADEVARGNLSHRVTTIAEDELALLAASFNQMTTQLEENRRSIEAGAAELRDKNLALEERRQYIETVLESLSTGVISLDEHDHMTTINVAAMLMLRLAEIPPAGTALADVVNADDRLVLERVLRRARRTGRAAWQMELARGASHDDGVVPVALTATALASKGTGRGVVLVIEDLSELLAAQRAAAWSEVARRMAHEIKNPLTPIQLSAERIARNFRRDADEAQSSTYPAGNGDDPARAARVARIVEECTTTISREVAGLKAMVDEFTRFARLPHARLEVADLNEVVRQAIALYEDRLEGVRMDVHLARQLPAAMLDAEQMRRVFVNLIDNALEALADAHDERRITIATGHDPSRGLLLIEIADNGHGIATADYSRLFQPYFSTRGRGTGLGLAIVQRIVTEHGGRIRAEANRPRGAKLIVELPITDEISKMSDARYQTPEQDKELASSI